MWRRVLAGRPRCGSSCQARVEARRPPIPERPRGGSRTGLAGLGLLVLVACSPDPPHAAIPIEPVSGAAPLPVQFADGTSGECTGWEWDFGDGSISSLRNPLHVYRSAGTYDVSLTATGPGGVGRTLRRSLVTVRGSAPADNVLVIVADDVSADEIGCYGLLPDVLPEETSSIDALAARGVLFEAAWTNPFCSASRAQILTGRHAFRTGIGNQIESSDVGLSPDELTLNEALVAHADGSYATSYFGKWHLEALQSDYPCAPTDRHGFDAFDGNLFQVLDAVSWLHVACPPPGAVPGKPWRADPHASATLVHEYLMTYVTDRAIEWIQAQQGPWFCVFAPQSPYHFAHVPPASLQQIVEGEPGQLCEKFDRTCFLADLKAFDTEVGRLLASLGPDWEENVTVFLLADNGTPKGFVRRHPAGHGKGSLYEAGVRVPLVVAGRAVAPERRGTREGRLVCSTDLYRTITDLAGATDLPDDVAEDSISFLPLLRSASGAGGHPFLYAEYFHPNASRPPFGQHFAAVRDQRYKLLYDVGNDAPWELYDLVEDPFEERDLLQPTPPDPGSPEGRALEQLLEAVRATPAG